jgi:hypothetical protein
MSDYLSQISKPKVKPPIISIVGYPGAGKTSLAAMFPAPIFIQTDDNSETVFQSWPEDLQPAFMPKIPRANAKKNVRPSDIVLDQLRELASKQHDFKTVVFDTSTSLNLLIEEEVTIFDPAGADNIADASGGFHKGYKTVATKQAKIRNACEELRKRGMTVVFLCHTAVHKIKNSPDLPECTVYGIDMHPDSRPFYVNHSDAVLYLKQLDYNKGLEVDKKGKTTKLAKLKKSNERILVTSSDGVFGFVDAKNCFSMPNEITVPPMSNPILQYIPYLTQYAQLIEEDFITEEDEGEVENGN